MMDGMYTTAFTIKILLLNAHVCYHRLAVMISCNVYDVTQISVLSKVISLQKSAHQPLMFVLLTVLLQTVE